jgi:PAS domain S-box-containing protein
MDDAAKPLSERERTVLLLAAEGLTDKQIALSLGLSRRTIGTYWERMRQKYGSFPRAQLVARFLRAGGPATFGELFSRWSDGVWIVSPHGRTLYSNDRVAVLFGMQPEDFTELPAAELLREATGEELDRIVASAKVGAHEREIRVDPPHRPPHWIRLRATLSDANGKAALVVIATDVTLQKRVDAALTSCDATLAFVSEYSSDFIARFDDQFVCVSANPSLLTASRVTRESVVGRPLQELERVFSPTPDWCQALRRCVKENRRQAFDAVLPDGRRAETHVLPEPTSDLIPRTVITLTRTTP